MKVNLFTQKPTTFKGVREDRNTTAQLKQNNDYSLTEPNQRRINKAIENLAKQRGEENIKFLLDVGENIKYQTNIDNGKATKNEWKNKLKNATKESLAHSNPILREKYEPEIKRVFDDKKALNVDEKAILAHKKSIMKYVDMSQLDDNPNENIKNLEKNMDYFITSTETPTKQKRYVMQKLDFFMSPNYKINPQLEDKKTKVLAEMMNDLVINTPESRIPNMKAVNQKSHGMCAAISIARKAVAYEDKPNYVDAILSELDNKDTMKVYDRQNLGSGERVPVKKTFVDFDYAQQKGYRIIDASTLQWMNVAGMYGATNENLHDFNAFDKNNFDAFHDAFFTKNFDDNDLKSKQCYYQALSKAKDDIGSVKSSKIKSDLSIASDNANYDKNLKLVQQYNDSLKKDIKSILPSAKKDEIQTVVSDLHKLSQPVSEDIDKLGENLRDYAFIPNEETSQKHKKIRNYFMDNFANGVDEKALKERTDDLIDSIDTIDTLEKSLHSSTPQSKQVANARKLYEAEAIYRASTILGLFEKDNLTDNLIKYNIPDRETRVSQGYATVIDRIQKKDDKKLMAHFAAKFEVEPDDKEAILEGLNTVKESIDYLSTKGFDQLYTQMGYGSRRAILLNEINASAEQIKSGDKDELRHAAVSMNVKQDKNTVLKEYDKLEKNINEHPSDEKVYAEVFNKLGFKDQSNAFADVFNSFVKEIADNDSPNSQVYKAAFKEASGLAPDTPDEVVFDAINKIGSQYNMIASNIDVAADMLEVKNDDGTSYFTASGKDLILQKLEKDGTLIPEKDMAKLQDRFTRIDKIRSQDEFSSRQGKIADPSLYKFSAEEKAAIKKIDKKVNAMYSDVVRNLNYQYKDIKKPLEDLAREVGTNEGTYWVSSEGHSGLYTAQQVKIFEQLTDKPYYELSDLNRAVDIIKDGVHSGVSSSSVFHDRMGGHAQYVADIRENEKNGKNILFHDNTWGASEHENTWIDSEGLMRTDYSDRRGGELGYITDENWRNGNYVENLTHKKGHISPDDTNSKIYKKINGSGSDFDFPLMSGIIVQGKNPDLKDIAGSIKDAIYIPDSVHIGSLEKQANKMTKQQIQKAIFRNENAAQGYKTKLDKVMKRIETNTFHKGIDSLEDYNKLSENDLVKVSFEKAAIRESYPDASMYKELAGVSTMKEVKNVKKKQVAKAKENFNYAFGKNEDILLYMAYEHGKDMGIVLSTALKDNNIKVPDDKLPDILKNVAIYEKDEKKQFNGSMKDTIDFSVNKAVKQFSQIVPQDNENAINAKEEFEEGLRNLFNQNLYFNKEDLKSDSDSAKGIRNWIDEKFNPTTDDDFVKIYRNLQDMKKEDFDKITNDVSNKQLGMRDITGYDMLVGVKAANNEADSTLRNTLFYDEYVKDVDMSKTQTTYKYGKTERKSRGAIYRGARTFDDLYRTMNYSLSTLDYEKMFNKYKDVNFRNYRAFPAYPKMNLDGAPGVEEKIHSTIDVVNQTMATVNAVRNTAYSIKLTHKLDDYRNSIPVGRKLTPTERKTINTMAGEFITNNFNDPDVQNSLQAAYEIVSLDKDADISSYKKPIDTMLKEMKSIEKINSQERLNEVSKANLDALKNYFNVLLATNVPPKFHKIMKEDINNMMNAQLKSREGYSADKRNKNILKLEDKIASSSKPNNDKKAQTDSLTRIYSAITKTKPLKEKVKPEMTKLYEIKKEYGEDSLEYMEQQKVVDAKKQELQAQLDKVDKATDKFVEKYIADDKKQSVKGAFNEYINKSVIGGKKQAVSEEMADKTFEKFGEDFAKYHYSKHPTEILKNFLLASASDSSDDKLKNCCKRHLENELELAKFIDIQDSLINAVSTGNAAEVKNYFDEFYVDIYNNGDSVSMNSDESIDYMIRNLIMENNNDTAKMFVEKLGLGDRIMDLEQKLLIDLKPKEKIDTIADILRNTGEFSTVSNRVVGELGKKIDDSDDYVRDIEMAKQELIKQTKGLKNKKPVKVILQSLDETKDIIDNNPDIPKSALLNQYYRDAMLDIQKKTNEDIKEPQEYLNLINVMYQFLGQVHLPEYSKGYKIQQDIKNDYKDLTEYNNRVIGEVSDSNSNVVIMKKEV